MKKIFFVFFLLIFSIMMVSDLRAQSGAAKGRGRVKITVTDAKGKPLENVTIHFENPARQATFEAKTDAKGEKTINGIATGTWNIDFIKDGYVTRQIAAQIMELSYNKPIELSLEEAIKPKPGEVAGGQAKAPGADLVAEGDALKDKGDKAGAIAKYEQAAQLNPNFYRLYGDIGELYLGMDQKDKAMENFKKFLEKEPDNATVKIVAAQTLLQMGNAEEAKKMLTGLDLTKVTNASALYNLGGAFYNIKDTQEAIRYWEAAITVDPSLVDAHFQLGLAYYSMKQNDKAKVELNKVMELAPGSENATMAKEMLDSMQ
jgi:tetratricopeptide (TPR) repeat protein